MKKLLLLLLISASLGMVSVQGATTQGAPELYESMTEAINAIEKFDVAEVSTHLHRLDASSKPDDDKIAILLKLYRVAADVVDIQKKHHDALWLKLGSKIGYAQEIEQRIKQALDAKRLPLSTYVTAAYEAIDNSDLEELQGAIRLLERENLHGKAFNEVLLGLINQSEKKLAVDKEDLELPRPDRVKLKTGFLGTGIIGLIVGLRMYFNDKTEVALITGIYGALATLGGSYLSWRSIRRTGQQAQLSKDEQIHQYLLSRFKVSSPENDAEQFAQQMIVLEQAITDSDFETVKESVRELDRKDFYGKKAKQVLRDLVTLSTQVVKDYEENLSLPRTASDRLKVAVGTGLLSTGVGSLIYTATSAETIFPGIYGGLASLASLYPLWTGGRRSGQRSELSNAQRVHDYLQARLEKIAPTAQVEQSEPVTYEDFEKAVQASDLEKVRSLIWDLECSDLKEEAQYTLLDKAYMCATEVLTKREEDMAYTGSWKKLKLDGLSRRSWKDIAKVYTGGIGSIAAGVYAVMQVANKPNKLYNLGYGALGVAMGNYLVKDGLNRTTQIKQLTDAEEIKQLLRRKAN